MSAVTQTSTITELSNRDECPCCHSVKDLDEHHWSYSPEVTVDICRSCHVYLHDNKRVREQGENWQQECLERLAMLDAIHNPGEGRLLNRYNIPENINTTSG
jgi:hypothetical protein